MDSGCARQGVPSGQHSELCQGAHAEQNAINFAARYGITEPSYTGDPGDDCILCGLCVRVCDQVVGVSALGFSSRGPARKMVSPFQDPSPTCIGCGSCVYVCPTQCLHIADEGANSIIACATHPIFAGDACKRVMDSPIKDVVVTNSVPFDRMELCSKVKVLDVSDLMAEAIKRIHYNESVSTLFV